MATKKQYRTEASRRDQRVKLKQVLEAVGEITVRKLVTHPLLKKSGITTRSAGQTLKYLAKAGEIKFLGQSKWAPLQTSTPSITAIQKTLKEQKQTSTPPDPLTTEVIRKKYTKKKKGTKREVTAVTEVATSITPKGMYFILYPAQKKIMLDVGGLRLPLLIDPD